jgi:antitoxin component YwqK of YwqJK toxin-antitoxin module
MKTPFYILILVCLFSCKSTKIISETTTKKAEMEFYKNGLLKSIGQVDSDFLSKSARIGFWSEFYENGKLKESGEYASDTYTNCCTAGLCDMVYSYKIGEWNYFYDSGQLKAKGIYKLGKKHINTSCEGGDEINFGVLDNSWEFYDKNGNEIELTEKELKEMDKNGMIDEFDVMGK